MGISFPVGVALSTLSYIERMGEGKCLENLQYKIKWSEKMQLYSKDIRLTKNVYLNTIFI